MMDPNNILGEKSEAKTTFSEFIHLLNIYWAPACYLPGTSVGDE